MSLSLEEIKGEFREGYQRTEEVLSGMDAYIMKLEKRISLLEKQQHGIELLTARIDEIETAIYADETDLPVTQPKIYVG
jgi:hypothetical protein